MKAEEKRPNEVAGLVEDKVAENSKGEDKVENERIEEMRGVDKERLNYIGTLKTDKVNIAEIRQFALDYLPNTSVLRDIILSEKEELSKEEFIAKLEIWLRLFKKESGL